MKCNEQRFSGMKIESALREQGRRQDWLAAQLGVSGAAVNRWLRGSRTIGEADARRVASILGVPFFLLFDTPFGKHENRIGNEEAA